MSGHRPLLAYLLLLYLLFTFVIAENEAGSIQDPQHSQEAQNTGTSEQDPAETQIVQPQQPGAHHVQQAQLILQTVRIPITRSQRSTKPIGLLAIQWYYIKEFLRTTLLRGKSWGGSRTSGPPITVRNAINQLHVAAKLDNADAHYLIADAYMHGRYGLTRNYTTAYHHYSRLATMNGNSTAQYMLGFFWSTGFGGVVEQSQAKALVYHTFAADAGNTKSQMAMAYRHSAGIATPRNCEKSVVYYKQVAEKAMQYDREGPPGGRGLIKESYRLADNEGGVYGEGASVSSAGHNARQASAADSEQNMDNYLEYLDLISRKGDLKVTLMVGQFYYAGSRSLKQDFIAARECFQEVARRYWTRDGKIKSDVDRELEKLASKAAGYLGSMFLRGEGVKQNFDNAKVWYRRGIESGDALSQYGLGLMHLHGLAMEPSPVKAADFFGAAADQDHAGAQVRFGALLMDQGDLAAATKYFEYAARNHNMEGFYYLAELTDQGVGRDRSCTTASLYYKIVTEKVEAMHSNFAEANNAYRHGDRESALLFYMQAAEQGYESAQANVAYILDSTARTYSSPFYAFFPSIYGYTSIKLSDAALALTYWTRSAAQKNVDSLVKMGDYYLSGIGTELGTASSSANDNSAAPDKAAACYIAAAETQMSAQALWNLGWMHENGLGGLSRDFHLAKRHYDLSLETNAEAYLPVTLALMRLRVRSWWNGVTRGEVKGMDAGEKLGRRRSVSEWFWSVLDAELNGYDTAGGHNGDGGVNGGDVVANNGEEWDAGVVDDALYGYDELEDEGIFETIVFAGLAAGLAVAVWYRHNVRRRRQTEGNQGDEQPAGERAGQGGPAPAADNDRGLFPAPGDPAVAEWAAGGAGR